MSSGNLNATLRDKLGSRSARKLRREGRIPASLQADGQKESKSLHISEEEFMTARRQHIHLFDLEMGGATESAVVRELQWDQMGDRLLHVDFKRVQRGVATESEVELEFIGNVADGILTHNVTHITISCLPSLIPDAIDVNVNQLSIGQHIRAEDLILPEGIELAVPGDLEIAVVTAPAGHVEEEPAIEEGAEPIVESEEKRQKREDEGDESEG